MKKNYFLLVLLSAIWGSSFIFMRVLAPVFGPGSTACFRLLIGSFTLIAYFRATGFVIDWRRHGRILVVIGIINSAIPFLLYAFAALYIPSSLSVMVNATAPMFGSFFAYVLLKEKLSTTKVLGLSLGILGVGIMTYSKALPRTEMAYLALLACIGAATCYGLSANLIKKYGQDVPAKSLAGGSQLIAGLVLVPWVFIGGIPKEVQGHHFLLLIIFGSLCSGIAYLIYYHILKHLGPTKTLTVTFLMPVFGVFWAWTLLAERIYPQSILGGCLVLLGTFGVIKVQKNKCTYTLDK